MGGRNEEKLNKIYDDIIEIYTFNTQASLIKDSQNLLGAYSSI